MAGHSQFANIKHRKSAQDAQKAKLFTKARRNIIVAAMSGQNPNFNPELKAAIHNAKKIGFSKQKIDQAIQSSQNSTHDQNFAEILYEGYAISGSAFIIRTLTDNKNRTAADIRAILSKNGGRMAEKGSVTFMFKNLGSIIYKKNIEYAELFDLAIKYGCDDIIEKDTCYQILCPLSRLYKLTDILRDKNGPNESSSSIWIPKNKISVDDLSQIDNIIAMLEDSDDVQDIYTNVDLENI